MTLSTSQVPYTGPYSLPTGPHRSKGPTAEALKRAMKRAGYGFESTALGSLDQHYNEALEAALDKWNAGKGWNGYGEKRYDAIRALKISSGSKAGEYALDSYAQDLIRKEASSTPPPATVPALGPCYSGGKTVLEQDLTHATSGIALYPAFDDAFSQGRAVIAPEALTVTRSSSSNPGLAFYADGASGLRYWFGHLDRTHNPGVKFAKGATIGYVAANNVGGGPHVHVAVNCEKYPGYGPGSQLKHHTNYTHGAPLIGDQLRSVL